MAWDRQWVPQLTPGLGRAGGDGGGHKAIYLSPPIALEGHSQHLPWGGCYSPLPISSGCPEGLPVAAAPVCTMAEAMPPCPLPPAPLQRLRSPRGYFWVTFDAVLSPPQPHQGGVMLCGCWGGAGNGGFAAWSSGLCSPQRWVLGGIVCVCPPPRSRSPDDLPRPPQCRELTGIRPCVPIPGSRCPRLPGPEPHAGMCGVVWGGSGGGRSPMLPLSACPAPLSPTSRLFVARWPASGSVGCGLGAPCPSGAGRGGQRRGGAV